MKIYSFLAAILSILALTSAAPRTIIAPEFESAPLTFRIGAVHLSDSSTRIDADIYQRPKYWVRADTNIYLRSRITDNTYPIRRIEGMKFGEQVYGGDSAHIRATFVFDPLAPSDTVFDFVEPNGRWNVRGIDLNYTPKGVCTKISGIIHNRPTASWLVLTPNGDDFRVNKTIIIPVNNGKFEYNLYNTDTIAYDLAVGMELLSGAWKNTYLFSEGTPIELTMEGPDGFEIVNAGELTLKNLNFIQMQNGIYDRSGLYSQIDSLYKHNLYFSQAHNDIMEKLQDKQLSQSDRQNLYNQLDSLRKNKADLSPIGSMYNEKLDSVKAIVRDSIYDFIENDRSLVSLNNIYSSSIFHDSDLQTKLDFFKNIYAGLYPNHPYTIMLNQLITDEKAKVGCKFPDFTAPDLNGNNHALSELIAGKFAVIDLWASWCGSCRKHSIDLIPVYEKWKDKGFTVVGVAREADDTRAMEYAIKKDGYPWINLVELNDAGNIWKRYLAGNAGGKIVFVAPSGTIISIQPSAEEVDNMLTKFLGDK